MGTLRTPTGLSSGGKKLWSEITAVHELDPTQVVQLTEACRAKDRLDQLDALLRGDISEWSRVKLNDLGELSLKIDDVLHKANTTANIMKQLLAALRLPDEQSGKRPQVRSARGAYSKPGKVSSLDRARAAHLG